ncbi:nuclear transport factor 2 family protein [Phenylobacterium sp.]|jgi:ketosteroid isomerase-like protein|uniref:nuclear transport factor 2 family protein n=1 Tax=Phenylobacterium sp. TaxID=1871053 RepID=UPI002F3EA2AF
MAIEDRLDALEARLQAAEDQLAIIRLLSTYGPAVDSGSSREGAALWTEDGVYDVGGMRRAEGHDAIAALYDSQGHRELIFRGSAHLTATPRITVTGDTAEAVGYSFVMLRSHKGWYVWRASANRWTLTRTPDGWRIVERYNRPVDGSEDSHATLRHGAK